MKQKTSIENKKADNEILIGEKPLINYIRSAIIQLKKENKNEIILKARGKFITKAVDIAEITRKKSLAKENLNLKNIKIDSQDFTKDSKTTTLSTIEITLSKPSSSL
jgi:DNA-binding protein